MQKTTAGKILLSRILPKEYKVEAPLDGKGVGLLFTRMAKELPREEYVDVLHKLNNFGNDVTTEYGGIASIHLSDLRIPDNLRVLRKEMKSHINSIIQNKKLSGKEKKKLVLDYVRDLTPEIDKQVLETLGNSNNSFGILVKTKTRGNPVQLRQLVFGDLITVDSQKKEIPYPTLRSYGEGVTPLQYWTASHGGRQGYIAIQKATADAGYFSKQIRGTVHKQVVTAEDCGRARPLFVDSSDENNIGSVLCVDAKLKNGKTLKAGTILTEDVLDDLPPKVGVRSAETCGQGEGVCSLCAGIRETGKLPDIGDAVGLNGVNSFLEGLTQSGLSSKHSGGEATSVKRVKKGLEAVDQFVNMPENFVGGAVMVEADGVVSDVRPAPQGGSFLKVGDREYHIPADNEIIVKRGDFMEAGDLVTNGMPNMGKITIAKGIGEGRKQFTDTLYKLLKDNGAGTHKKHLETFARGFVSRVEITDPDGLQGWIYGDIADYNVLERSWKPRKSAVERDPRKAINDYLDRPALHYTIGTRITPRVAKDLTDNGVSSVLASPEAPPFIPYMPSAKQMQPTDEDWITALSGENLTKSIIQHTQRGADSLKNSTSIYPRLAMVSGNYPKPLTID
jgi:DNA-directed RNA polymerase subunit beta'